MIGVEYLLRQTGQPLQNVDLDSKETEVMFKDLVEEEEWPDCSHLVEAIIVRLCGIHKSPKKQGKDTLTRWTLILQDYHKIQ
ncbi:hypothetical protein AAFF_G00010260 [Aldrovandia affinis]|uniref:Uncharacterized protein n=1 Tax=Aldrovandia affinis TaxID=143900 RepID=A0AAD7S719_9TELE|nr:hypothetical protein AAFF_G00010260 [Aldrovandia affinis]